MSSAPDIVEITFVFVPKGETGTRTMQSAAYSAELAENQARSYCTRNGHEFIKMQDEYHRKGLEPVTTR